MRTQRSVDRSNARFAERNPLCLGADGSQNCYDNRHRPGHDCERQPVIAAVMCRDCGLKSGIRGRQKPGKVPRALSGDNSFKCTGTTPHAPWTMNCIRKAPSASSTGLAENAQRGTTDNESNAAMMIIRRLPKRSDKEPNSRPPHMAPIL